MDEQGCGPSVLCEGADERASSKEVALGDSLEHTAHPSLRDVPGSQQQRPMDYRDMPIFARRDVRGDEARQRRAFVPTPACPG